MRRSEDSRATSDYRGVFFDLASGNVGMRKDQDAAGPVRPKGDFKRHLQGEGRRLSAPWTGLHVTRAVARDYFDQLVGSR